MTNILMKNARRIVLLAFAAVVGLTAQTLVGEEFKPPNLLIIQTDEHNFRTLGCYRQQMSPEQAHVWGRGVRVETPHIDSIAPEGAICTSFYAASPVCSAADTPWLFDLKREPDELTNFYADPAYRKIATRFRTRLVELMKQFDEPAMTKVELRYE